MHPAPLNDLPPHLADELSAHVYRRQVASELEWVWPARARGLRSCGEAAAGLRCRDCGAHHLAPYRCSARSCPSCARIASAAVVERVAGRAETALASLRSDETPPGLLRTGAKRWRLFTGTLRARGRRDSDERYELEHLRGQIRQVRRAWGAFWRSSQWGEPMKVRGDSGRWTRRARRDTMFAAGLEVAPGGMVHVHAAVHGEYVSSAALGALWSAALEEPAFIKVQGMRGADPDELRRSLHEVLKYVNKGDGDTARRAWRAASIELAMRSVRRVEMGGALRGVQVSQADLIRAGALACEECGSSSQRWAWEGIRATDYVAQNGGFGLDRIAAPGHVRKQLEAAQRRERSAWPVVRDLHGAGEFDDADPFDAGTVPRVAHDPAALVAGTSHPVNQHG